MTHHFGGLQVALIVATYGYAPLRFLYPIAVALLLVLGFLGVAMRRFGLPVLPLIVGVILGPSLENQLTQALALSGGEVSTLWSEPVAKIVYVVLALALVALAVSTVRGRSARRPEKQEVSA